MKQKDYNYYVCSRCRDNSGVTLNDSILYSVFIVLFAVFLQNRPRLTEIVLVVFIVTMANLLRFIYGLNLEKNKFIDEYFSEKLPDPENK